MKNVDLKGVFTMLKIYAKLKFLVIFTLIISVLYGCGGGASDVNSSKNEDMTAKYLAADQKAAMVGKDLAQANTKFSLKIFKEISKNSAGNIFISPLSVSMALSMMYNGATGETLLSMASALELSGFDLNNLNQQYRNLIESLVSVDAGIVLNIANSMWVRSSFMPEVNTAFIQTLQNYYSCAPNALDFSKPEAVTTINAWIEKQTNGMIKNIITQIDDGIVMFLINALYFKGEWVNKFDPANTVPANFYGTDGTAKSVSMMSASNKIKYFEGLNFSAARLPYGRDKIAMYIFLPKTGTTLDAFIAGLNAAEFETAMAAIAAADQRTVNIKMPKFKFEYGVKRLNDELKTLGMSIPFDPQKADFSGMARNVFIQFVDHKAVIDVNEKGSEAAAVTIIGVGVTSVPVDIINFSVERPFFFMIYDDRSQSVLFMGKVTDPKYN